MTVRLLYFGPMREVAGSGQSREVPAEATVGWLLGELLGEGRLPAELLRRSAVAVNLEYVKHDRPLAEGDEVAILPPVSGGTR